MNFKKLFFLIILVCYYSYASASVIINNRSVNVDLSEIINNQKREYSETEVKQLCVKITSMYHSSGYTAFFIKRALIRKDGGVELDFNESRVAIISVTGLDAEQNNLLGKELYKKDGVFNEFILNDNIRIAKDKYSLRRITVDIVRRSDGDVELHCVVKKRLLLGIFELSSDPLYGIYSNAELTFYSGMINTDIYLKSSFEREKVSFSEGGVACKTTSKNSGIFLGGNYSVRNDAADDYGYKILSDTTTSGSFGYYFNKGPSAIKLYLLSSYSEFENNSGHNNGVSFSGGGFSATYNDSEFRIDPSESVAAGFDIALGKNLISQLSVVRAKAYGTFNFPVRSDVSLNCDLNSLYTTEDDRFFKFYVFNREVPLREKDYTVSAWKSLFRTGLALEPVKGFFFIIPEYIAAFYTGKNDIKSTDGFGLRLKTVFDTVRFEACCSLERGGEVHDAVLSYAAYGLF